ncbi:hypothetical protein [Salmonella enterica]|uniref:hypothetical protein n=1 Tax=Salmonella enterica TaxID=28901 RepID=UPI0018F8CEFA|nr:hypothetical protein [Salmonella enterica]
MLYSFTHLTSATLPDILLDNRRLKKDIIISSVTDSGIKANKQIKINKHYFFISCCCLSLINLYIINRIFSCGIYYFFGKTIYFELTKITMKTSQAKPSQAKPSQAKPSQGG